MVQDQKTAESLKAWYRQLCKRPTFHDEYLQSCAMLRCFLELFVAFRLADLKASPCS